MRQVGPVALVFLLAVPAPAAARDCDRTCTLQVSDAVLSALQTGQFGKLLPRSVRVTENGRDIRPADSQLRAFKNIIKNIEDISEHASRRKRKTKYKRIVTICRKAIDLFEA